MAIHIGSGATPRGGSAVYRSEGVPFIRSQNVRDGLLDLTDVARISAEIHSAMRRSTVRPGDVLLNITGASIGRSCVVPTEVREANVNQHVCIIRCNGEVVPSFVQAMLELPHTQQQIRDTAAGGSREGLNFQQVAALSIPWVAPAVQRVLERLRAKSDVVLLHVSDILVAKRRMQRGLMRELLTGQLRFPEFGSGSSGQKMERPPEGWDVLSLGDVAEIRVSNVDKHSRPGESSVRLCNYMDVWTRPFISGDQPFMEATASEAEIERFHIQPGDVLLTKDSETREEIAQPSVVISTCADLVLGYHLALVRPTSARALGTFVAAQLRLPRFRQHFVRAAQGATRFGLTLDALQTAPVWLPSVAEQTRIAELDLQLHREIELLEAQRGQFELQKRAVTQKLLSGGVQIHVDQRGGQSA